MSTLRRRVAARTRFSTSTNPNPKRLIDIRPLLKSNSHFGDLSSNGTSLRRNFFEMVCKTASKRLDKSRPWVPPYGTTLITWQTTCGVAANESEHNSCPCRHQHSLQGEGRSNQHLRGPVHRSRTPLHDGLYRQRVLWDRLRARRSPSVHYGYAGCEDGRGFKGRPF